MNLITFLYKNTCLIPDTEIATESKKLIEEIIRIKDVRNKKYHSQYAFMHAPFDIDQINYIQKIAKEKAILQPSLIIIVGIGGSNLGTIAIHEAINGIFYNEIQQKIKIYFADTVDADFIDNIMQIAEETLQKGYNVILNVVSKSGTTLESIVNFEIFLSLLRKYKKNHEQYIVVSTEETSPLWQQGTKEKYTCLTIPKEVGGRFSVFSSAALFPLTLLGIDITNLLSGARDIITHCLSQDTAMNTAAMSAILLALHYKKKGVTIHDTFIFSKDLHGVGQWYRQLMAESIGKTTTKSGLIQNIGITPTVAIGSTDLHSVAQLYLAGPYDKFTTFVSVEQNKSAINIPIFSPANSFFSPIQGQSLTTIMDAIMYATKEAYQKRERPFVSFVFPQKSAYYIGQFLQLKMFEIVYLAYLLDVNPFDQPQVELYKDETQKKLGLY